MFVSLKCSVVSSPVFSSCCLPGNLIFLLPLLGGGNYILDLLDISIVDFRVLLVVFGGTVFPIWIILELVAMVKHKKLEKTYVKMFHSSDRPVLPDEHFFK